jgi:hypothetical protein
MWNLGLVGLKGREPSEAVMQWAPTELGPGGVGLRVGEPGGAEQWLHRSMGQEFGGLAVLLVDCGMEKPSTS